MMKLKTMKNNPINTLQRNEGILMYYDKRIDDFLKLNKIDYNLIDLPNEIKGFTNYKNGVYHVAVNMNQIQNQVELYGQIINILKNDFCNSQDNIHYKKIFDITNKLETLYKEFLLSTDIDANITYLKEHGEDNLIELYNKIKKDGSLLILTSDDKNLAPDEVARILRIIDAL